MKTSSNNPKLTKTLGKGPARRKRRGSQFLRFRDVKGKTVDFVEMCTAAEFPCIEIGFADKTALHFTMDTRLTMEPTYSNWKTGNQRLLRRWAAVECR